MQKRPDLGSSDLGRLKVRLAEPAADVLAVSTTVIMFTVVFSKAMRRLEARTSPA